MNATLTSGALFLVRSLFELIIFVIVLRMMFQFLRAGFRNPICQFTYKFTNPGVKPLQRFIPTIHRIDYAALVLAFFFGFIEFGLVLLIQVGTLSNPIGLALLSCSAILSHVENIFFYGILIHILIGWVSPSMDNPLVEILYVISEPLLRPARKIIPTFEGFDISPIPILILLKLFDIMIIQYIQYMGFKLSVF